MESNVIYAESLKFSFCMLYQIYSLLLNDECEAYLNLFLPSLFYFSTFRNIPRFLFSKFPKFKQLLCKIANRLKLKLTNLNKALQTENEETKSDEPEDSEKFNKLLEIYLLNIDKSLMGFLPLKKYYLETKKEYKIYTKENQYQLKLHLALQLLEKIDCFEGNPEDNIGEALTIMEFEMPLMEDFKNVINYNSCKKIVFI